MDIYKDIYFRTQDELYLYFYVSAVTTKKRRVIAKRIYPTFQDKKNINFDQIS